MRFLLLAALLLAVLSGVSCQNTSSCDNILFTERLGDFWDDILYLSSPEPYDGTNQICSFHFDAGADQCCSESVYDIVRNVWIRVRSRIAIAVTLAKTVRRAWEDARDKFRPVRNEVDKALERGQITQVQHDALIDFINRVLAAWDNFLDRLIDDWARCLTLVLKYWAGVICLGCDPNWEQYIYENGQGEIRLKLTVDTCNSIRSECLPIWQLVFEFIEALHDAVNQLITDLGGAPINYDGQICDGDCGAWLCQVFFSGRDAQTDSLPSPNSKKRNSDHIQTIFKHLESEVTKAYHPHKGEAFVESFSGLLWHTHNALHAFEEVHRQTSGASNEYVDGGYNPVEVGEHSGLETKVDGSASGLSSWLSTLLSYVL